MAALLFTFEFWPMLIDVPDWAFAPEHEYGPITSETVKTVVSTELEAAHDLLPAPPDGCYWGLVGVTPEPEKTRMLEENHSLLRDSQ